MIYLNLPGWIPTDLNKESIEETIYSGVGGVKELSRMVKLCRGARTCSHYYSKTEDVGEEMMSIEPGEQWSHKIKVTKQGL